VRLDVAGRTDAGVHAIGQVVSFDVPDGGVDPGPLQLALNKLLPADLVVTAASKVPTDFHARFSAVARRYRFRMLNAPLRDPLRLGVVWHVPEPLDRVAMESGGSVLLGKHDFTSFCRRPKDTPEASLVRRVSDVVWLATGDELWFEIEANAFCHQMVRSIVGLLVDVGLGRRTVGTVADVLALTDRAALRARLAPAQGLTLLTVRYGE
jgi:tRNA pseudouridine38-40 synthase